MCYIVVVGVILLWWVLYCCGGCYIVVVGELQNLMEIQSVMDDGNCSKRNVNQCRGYMLDMVAYYSNFYRNLGDVFGLMIKVGVCELNELVNSLVLTWYEGAMRTNWT